MLRLALLALVGGLLLAAGAAQAYTCSSFSTCEEAMRSIRAGNIRLDGDWDGVPCESLCRGYTGRGSVATSPYQRTDPDTGSEAGGTATQATAQADGGQWSGDAGLGWGWRHDPGQGFRWDGSHDPRGLNRCSGDGPGG